MYYVLGFLNAVSAFTHIYINQEYVTHYNKNTHKTSKNAEKSTVSTAQYLQCLVAGGEFAF